MVLFTSPSLLPSQGHMHHCPEGSGLLKWPFYCLPQIGRLFSCFPKTLIGKYFLLTKHLGQWRGMMVDKLGPKRIELCF